MSIKSLLFVLFLYVCLVWVAVAHFYSGVQLREAGLLWTGAGLLAALLFMIGAPLTVWLKARRAKAATAPSAARRPAEPVHEDDVTLAAILAEANATLAKAPAYAGHRGAAPIAALPMYLLVGPEGSGKTTTFLNSGLEPEALAGQANGGGPTRLCSLWLARNALFVLISGRVFSGDPGRWAQTLRILRGGAPVSRWQALRGNDSPQTAALRGVVGFCDAKEFTSAATDPQRFERYCRTWQDRLRAIGEVFGSEFPVYQVISKADVIPYFPDFFRRLPESDAGQVLGCTMPLSAPGAVPDAGPLAQAEAQRITSSFRQLYNALAERRIVHLAHEPDPNRRQAVYEFPRELKRIRTPLVQLLTDVFRPHPLVPGPTLRGFYLTAVREVELAAGADPHRGDFGASDPSMESTKLFRVADATQLFRARDLGKTPAAATTPRRLALRWMFVADLFHNVVLADHAAPARPIAVRPFEKERRWAFTGVCVVCGLLCLIFGVSWWRNRQLLGEVSAASGIAIQKHGNLPSLADLQALDNLRAEIAFLRTDTPLSYHWGLYTGDRALAAAREVYFRNFQQLLLNDLNAELAATMRTAPASADPGQQYDPIYRALKTHLMITTGACAAEPTVAAQALKEARRRIAPATSADWQRLADGQIDFYSTELAYGNPCHLAEDVAARDRARDYLKRAKGVDRIYNAVLASAEGKAPKGQTLADLAPNYRQVLNGPADVAAVYNRGAWDVVRKASKEAGSGSLGESCVVGLTGEFADLKSDAGLAGTIQGMYTADYIDHWRKYLTGFSVSRYEGAADAARKLAILSDHNSPLLALFFLTGSQTSFPSAPADVGLLEKGAKTLGVSSLVKGAEKAKQEAEAAAGVLPGGTAQIARAFQPVQWVVPPGSDTWVGEKNTGYVDALAQLGQSMQAIARGGAVPDPAIHQTAGQAYDKAMEAARQIARGFKPAGVEGLDGTVQRLLEEPIQLSKRYILSDMEKAGKDKVNGELRAFCAGARVILRKYPFQPTSTEDATLPEVNGFFAPGSGEVWKFQAQSLADLTVKEGSLWKAKDPAKKPQVAPEMLAFLNRAQAVTDAFYPAGATQPQLTYTLRPKLDSSFASFILELVIDGRSYQWNNGLQKQFSWPAPPGTKETGAKAQIRTGPVAYPFSSRGGLWGIFRILADAEPRPLGSRTVEWKYVRGGSGGRQEPIEPAPVRMEIVDFPGGVDVFNPRFFDALQCPAKAVQ